MRKAVALEGGSKPRLSGEYRPRMGEPVGEEGHIKKGVGIPKQRQRAKEGYKKATVVARSRCRHAAQ